jgi:hypothetical protein
MSVRRFDDDKVVKCIRYVPAGTEKQFIRPEGRGGGAEVNDIFSCG